MDEQSRGLPATLSNSIESNPWYGCGSKFWQNITSTVALGLTTTVQVAVDRPTASLPPLAYGRSTSLDQFVQHLVSETPYLTSNTPQNPLTSSVADYVPVTQKLKNTVAHGARRALVACPATSDINSGRSALASVTQQSTSRGANWSHRLASTMITTSSLA